MNVLRDIAILTEEIRTRFQRMDIPPQCLNSRVKLRDDNPTGELILKLCIGGAFYNRYVKAEYKNEDLLHRTKNSRSFDHAEASQTIILNRVSDFVTEKHLKQFFEAKFKCPVKRVELTRDKPVIVFGPEILEKGFLKACFRLGARNRMSRYRKLEEEEYDETKKFKSAIMSDDRKRNKEYQVSYDEVREMLESEELRRPNYLYELRFETINKESYVDFEQDSINNFTSELDPNRLPHVTFACQEYYDKAGRFMCRNSTRLPEVPMVDILHCLVFAPLV
jgi:hypothetical protein